MTKLTDLPNEVLREIFSTIHKDKDSPHSMFEAMRTCRLFRDSIFGLVTKENNRTLTKEDLRARNSMVKVAEKKAIRVRLRRLRKSQAQIKRQARIDKLRGPALDYTRVLVSELQAEIRLLRRPHLATLKLRPQGGPFGGKRQGSTRTNDLFSDYQSLVVAIGFDYNDVNPFGRQSQADQSAINTARLTAFGTMGY